MNRFPSVVALLWVVAVAILSGCERPPTEVQAAARAAAAPVRSFPLYDKPRPLPELTFQDDRGRTVRLSDSRGKVVLLNIWATWCGPCREEMPTLDRLQAQLGGPQFDIVALSVDHDGPRPVERFFRDIGLKHLRWYIDPTPQTMDKLKILGLPATLLIDANGRELGRLLGAVQWDSPQMVQFLRGVIERDEPTQTTLLRAPAGR